MATNESRQFCDICIRKSYATTISKEWCFECNEALCNDCLEHHRYSASSLKHKTIAVEDFNQIPPFISEIKNKCDLHDQDYEYHCTHHNTVLCFQCLKEKHMQPPCGVKSLNAVLENVKNGEALMRLGDDINYLDDITDKIIQFSKKHLSRIEDCRSKCLEDVRRQRQIINKHLDDLENKLLDEISIETKESVSKITSYLEGLNDLKVRIETTLESCNKMKLYASDFQILVGINIMQEKIEELKKGFELLKYDGKDKFNSFTVDFPEDIIKDLNTFGNIKEILMKFPDDIDMDTLARSLCCQVQKTDYTDRIILIERQNLAITPHCGEISGCEIMDNGDLLFIDSVNKSLTFCFKNGSKRKRRVFEQSPCDVTCLDGNEAAVAFSNACVTVIDLKSKNLKSLRSFPINQVCSGIDYQNGTQVLVTGGNVLDIHNFKNDVQYDIDVECENISRISCHGEKTFCSDENSDAVYCINFNGSVIWTFKDGCLRKPFGIASDSKGYIYVAGQDSNNVVVISPDGKNKRVLLSGLFRPRSLAVLKSQNKLLVSDEGAQTLLLYDISHE